MSAFTAEDITGVILAGGQARRMGGDDKGLIKLNNKAMIEYVLEALAPQVNDILINANRNHELYETYQHPVIADELTDFSGPLAGFASAMKNTSHKLMLTVPCDSPFVPEDLAVRLLAKMNELNADISVAHNGERLQPVFCLLKTELLDSLQVYLENGERKIDRWFEQHTLAVEYFRDKEDAFLNINTPDDLEKIETKLQFTNE